MNTSTKLSPWLLPFRSPNCRTHSGRRNLKWCGFTWFIFSLCNIHDTCSRPHTGMMLSTGFTKTSWDRLSYFMDWAWAFCKAIPHPWRPNDADVRGPLMCLLMKLSFFFLVKNHVRRWNLAFNMAVGVISKPLPGCDFCHQLRFSRHWERATFRHLHWELRKTFYHTNYVHIISFNYNYCHYYFALCCPCRVK